jgi:hypothetical protein
MKNIKLFDKFVNESDAEFRKKYGSKEIFDLVSDYVSDHADNLKTHKVTDISINKFLADSGVKLSPEEKNKFKEVLNKESKKW